MRELRSWICFALPTMSRTKMEKFISSCWSRLILVGPGSRRIFHFLYKDQPFFCGWYQEPELVKNENGNARRQRRKRIGRNETVRIIILILKQKASLHIPIPIIGTLKRIRLTIRKKTEKLILPFMPVGFRITNSTIITRKMANGLYMERRVLTIKP